METTREWTDSRIKLIEFQLLDLVYLKSKNGEIPPLHPSYAQDLDKFEDVLAAAYRLIGEGLIKGNESADGSLSPYLTPEGKTLVLERKERRSDQRKRAVACRDALLDWSYGRDARNVDEFAGDVRAYFEGDPFSHEEIIAAAKDLMQKELLTGHVSLVPHGVIGPQITAAGKTVVERYGSSIGSYENRYQPAPSGGTVINIKSDQISGQLAIGDHNRLTQKTGAKTGELTELIAAVLDAAQGTPEEQRVGKLMAQLELEADEDEPDQTVMGKVLDRVEDVAADTISDALKTALKRLVHYAAGWYIQQKLGTN
jgi:hypothetical protein